MHKYIVRHFGHSYCLHETKHLACQGLAICTELLEEFPAVLHRIFEMLASCVLPMGEVHRRD